MRCPNCGTDLIINGHPYSEATRPISMWGYFGYELLFSIPIVGFILLLVFSFGGSRNINLKNFARSYFCFIIIAIVLVIIISSVLGGSVASSLLNL